MIPVRRVVAYVQEVFLSYQSSHYNSGVVIIHWWVREYPVTRAAEEARITKMTVIQFLRDICSWRLTTLDSPLILGGNGVVAQIDESLFRHKPKVDNP